MATHKLKIWKEYFSDVLTGMKTAEVRLDDRDYQSLDILVLEEFDPETHTYTGSWLHAHVSFVYRNVPGLLPGHVLMTIAPLTADDENKQYLPPMRYTKEEWKNLMKFISKHVYPIVNP